jgi:hypothetical protein
MVRLSVMGEDGRVRDNVRSRLNHGSVDHFIRAIRADFNQTGSLDGVSLRDSELVMTRETGEIVTRQIGAQRCGRNTNRGVLRESCTKRELARLGVGVQLLLSS